MREAYYEASVQQVSKKCHKLYLDDTHTLCFQLQDTVLLLRTVLILDPIHFRKYKVCLLIGSILNFEALLGAFF